MPTVRAEIVLDGTPYAIHVSAPQVLKKRGRKTLNGHVMNATERQQRARSQRNSKKKTNIAVLDFETDPFDNQSQTRVLPFLAVLYSDQFPEVVIWDENFDRLIAKVIAAIEALPEPYTIYAHNGGRFDYMFLIHKLRGDVKFKGRGIMAAHLTGANGITHELRDSFHIIPDRLASYKKDTFNYEKNTRANRKTHKKEIIKYCIHDCRYLLEIVRNFIDGFGLKLSFGQAAMSRLKEHYPDIEKLQDGWDKYLRGFFFGGRVECIQGAGEFIGPYKTFDVNSMYSQAMATYSHPIGGFDHYSLTTQIGPDTVFLDLNCDNRGALIARDLDTGETTARIASGNFLTTIWEYETALRLGLISNVEINFAVNCSKRTDFSRHIIPIYEGRLQTKAELRRLRGEGLGPGNPLYDETVTRDLFLKFLLNSGYGKFAQNPRNFKEHYLTDPDETPPRNWFRSLCGKMTKEEFSAAELSDIVKPDMREHLLPAEECAGYWIWSKPAPTFRFNNVGTAASITGAARSILLEAMHKAVDPIYCDTDAIICRDLPGVDIDGERLGAWDLEDEFRAVRICGKKLYGGEYAKPKKGPDGKEIRYKIRSKGVNGVTWQELGELIASPDTAEIEKKALAPTLSRTGSQYYQSRVIRVTTRPREKSETEK